MVKLTATRRHNTTPNLYALAAMLGTMTELRIVRCGIPNTTIPHLHKNPKTHARCLVFATGYFVHDFAVGLPTALSHKADMVHHLAGISIIANCFRVRQLLHHVPALTVLEASCPACLLPMRIQRGGGARW